MASVCVGLRGWVATVSCGEADAFLALGYGRPVPGSIPCRNQRDVVDEIWLSYFNVGGNAGPFKMKAFIYGVDVLGQIDLMPLERALIAARPPDVAV